MFCKDCGSELKPGAVFCGSCGVDLKQASAPLSREVKAMSSDMPAEARKQAIDSRRKQELADAAERAEVKHFYSKVSGVTFKNSDGTERQRIIENCHTGEVLLLVREPDNKYNPRAVKVVLKTVNRSAICPTVLLDGKGIAGWVGASARKSIRVSG